MENFTKKRFAVIVAIIVIMAIAAGYPAEAKADTSQCNAVIKSVGYNTVTINANTGNYWHSGVAIFRSTSKNSGYKKIKVIERYGNSWTYRDTKLKSGKVYYYKIQTFEKYSKKRYYGVASAIAGARPKLGAASIKKVTSKNADSALITWNRVEGSTGYEIYRSDKAKGGYTLIKKVDRSKSVRYTDKGLTVGKRYYYIVKAYRNTTGKTVYAGGSKKVSVVIAPCKPGRPSIVVYGPTSENVSWAPARGAQSYTIYRAEGNSNSYRKVMTTKATSYTFGDVNNGIYYSYKVKANVKIGNKCIRSEFSKAKGGYVDYYTYDNESFEHREKRIHYSEANYGTQAASEQNQVTITIRVWDFDSNGNKVTKNKSFKVNKYISESVKQAFEEIYNGNEKFPIHEIGAYSWRGDNSTSEHCLGIAIDINSNENCMMDGDTVVAGSFWKPYENPYSIPLDGEVARILKKYGFYQGDWGYRKDYMHFSYFGG